MKTKFNILKFFAKCLNHAVEPLFNKAMLHTLIYCTTLTPIISFAALAPKNTPPVAWITSTSTLGAAPFTATFDASRSKDWDGAITAYSWKFGDGSTAAGTAASHIYRSPGDYTVSLSVTDDQGAITTQTTSVSVITAPTPAPMGNRPTGIYSLDYVVDLPYVSGVTIRPEWSEIEPSEGVYDFSSIEQTIREAVLIGQSVTIANMVVDEPAWLMNKIPTANKYQGIWNTDIVPWDETMLLAMEKLAQAQSNFKIDGIALKNHPNVKQIDAPVGTANGIRLKTLPRNYTAELYKGGVTRSIQIWADAYPDKHLYTALFGVEDGTRTTSTTLSTAESLRNELMEEFNGVDKPKLNFFVEYWTGGQPTLTSDLLYDVKDQTSIMLQSCGSWTGQNSYWASCSWLEPLDTPEKGFNYAMKNFNTTYFEVYIDDLDNPDYITQFENAAIKIEALASTLD